LTKLKLSLDSASNEIISEGFNSSESQSGIGSNVERAVIQTNLATQRDPTGAANYSAAAMAPPNATSKPKPGVSEVDEVDGIPGHLNFEHQEKILKSQINRLV